MLECKRWECSFNINNTCVRSVGNDNYIDLCSEIDTELTVEIPQIIKELDLSL